MCISAALISSKTIPAEHCSTSPLAEEWDSSPNTPGTYRQDLSLGNLASNVEMFLLELENVNELGSPGL